MRAIYVRRADYGLYRQAIAMFGSWQKALVQAGINKELLYSGPNNPKLDRAAAVLMLKQRIQTGGVPTLAMLACENQYLARCLIARCGSFQAAVQLAAGQIQSGNDDKQTCDEVKTHVDLAETSVLSASRDLAYAMTRNRVLDNAP